MNSDSSEIFIRKINIFLYELVHRFIALFNGTRNSSIYI